MEFQWVEGGKDFSIYADVVTSLRISIFREWPYLYEGDPEIEAEYSKIYKSSPNSLLLLAKEKKKIIGVVTGIPLAEMDEYSLTPFKERKIPVTPIFYLGEILLLKEFRGRGMGYKMYAAFEEKIKKNPRFTTIAILRVICVHTDPRKPKDYRSLDEFWKRLGYKEQSGLSLQIPYKEVDSSEKITHLFGYSLKKLS